MYSRYKRNNNRISRHSLLRLFIGWTSLLMYCSTALINNSFYIYSLRGHPLYRESWPVDFSEGSALPVPFPIWRQRVQSLHHGRGSWRKVNLLSSLLISLLKDSFLMMLIYHRAWCSTEVNADGQHVQVYCGLATNVGYFCNNDQNIQCKNRLAKRILAFRYRIILVSKTRDWNTGLYDSYILRAKMSTIA